MKVNTNCEVCPFKNYCLMEGNPKRLRKGEGGISLCPKLQRMSRLKCRDCPFLAMTGTRFGLVIYECKALGSGMAQGGRLPKRPPVFCPIKEAKRKGL